MLFIEIRVNEMLPFTKIGVHRVKPEYTPDEGEICSYDIYEFNYDMEYNPSHKMIGKVKFPYGDGNLLTIEVLKIYTEYQNNAGVAHR